MSADRREWAGNRRDVIRKLFAGGDFFEGARWHGGAWWLSDIYGGKVWRIWPDGRGEVIAEVDQWPNGLGFLPNGDLLITSLKDRRLLRCSADGTIAFHADVAPHSAFWLNDMFVDRLGRAYIGNLGADLMSAGDPGPTTLCRIDPDGTGAVVAGDLLFPNGIAATRDGRTLIVAESLGNRLTAFTIDAAGDLHDRRVWASFGPVPPPSAWTMAKLHDMELSPDGIAIDAEDCVWVADAGNHRICRVAEGGRILEELRTPDDEGIYACALGGADGHTLLICAAPSTDVADCQGKGRAVLYEHRVAVPAP